MVIISRVHGAHAPRPGRRRGTQSTNDNRFFFFCFSSKRPFSLPLSLTLPIAFHFFPAPNLRYCFSFRPGTVTNHRSGASGGGFFFSFLCRVCGRGGDCCGRIYAGLQDKEPDTRVYYLGIPQSYILAGRRCRACVVYIYRHLYNIISVHAKH